MRRRQLLKYTASGAVITTALGIYASRQEPYQFHSSIAPIPTTTKYISGQPPLTDNRAIQATLLPTSDITTTTLRLESLPDDLRQDLHTGYESGFWVATVAVLPTDATFTPGGAKFSENTITYPNAKITDEGTKMNELLFHYVFHHWNDPRPLATKPKEVRIDW